MTRSTYFDTHTHLDDEQFADDIESVIAEATAKGVTAFVNIGYAPDEWQSTLALATRFPAIHYALGLHPVSTDLWSSDSFALLADLVRTTQPVAIGEIGLDYYWRSDNKSEQRTSFEAQIELACSVDLPIVIHQRSAADDVHSILTNAPVDLRVVLHSYDGDSALGDLVLERGWMLGVGGLMTRRQNSDLRERLQSVPLQQILLETDSPYLVPSGVKSRRNSPSTIPLIAERLSGLINRSIDEIASITTANALSFFRIPAPVAIV